MSSLCVPAPTLSTLLVLWRLVTQPPCDNYPHFPVQEAKAQVSLPIFAPK